MKQQLEIPNEWIVEDSNRIKKSQNKPCLQILAIKIQQQQTVNSK